MYPNTIHFGLQIVTIEVLGAQMYILDGHMDA